MKFQWLSWKKQTDTVVDGLMAQLGGVVLFIAVIWGVFLTDYIPYVEWHRWLALRPRQLQGLHGVVTMPFAHGGLAHVLSNTIPLIIMLITLAAMKPSSWKRIVVFVVLTSGSLTWLLGESNPIVGASGLVLGLVTFLISPGAFLLAWWLLNRVTKRFKPYPFQVQPLPLVVSAIVGFFCLDNLFFNLVPVFAPLGGGTVSWRAHWCGAVAGCLVALAYAYAGENPALSRGASKQLDASAA